MTVLRQGSAGEPATPSNAMVRASQLSRAVPSQERANLPLCLSEWLCGGMRHAEDVVSPDRPGAERGCRPRWERATVVMRLSHWSFMDGGRRKPEAGRGEHGGTAGSAGLPYTAKRGSTPGRSRAALEPGPSLNVGAGCGLLLAGSGERRFKIIGAMIRRRSCPMSLSRCFMKVGLRPTAPTIMDALRSSETRVLLD